MSNTANTTSKNALIIKEKRKRISLRYNIQGEIVAKSYVDNFHKTKRLVKQLITYDNLSYKVNHRELKLIQEN